jgi:hypothetical protein
MGKGRDERKKQTNVLLVKAMHLNRQVEGTSFQEFGDDPNFAVDFAEGGR